MNALGVPADPHILAALRGLIDQAAGASVPPSGECDEHAAQLIQEFLDEKGWSARDLANEIEIEADRRGRTNLKTSRKTIDRVLDGHVPRARSKAAIALVMGVPPWKIWGKGQMPLASQREQILNARTEVAA